MPVSFRTFRNLGVGSMILMLAVVSFMPSLIMTRLSRPNAMISLELSALIESAEINNLFKKARGDFDKFISQEENTVPSVIDSLDKAMVISQALFILFENKPEEREMVLKFGAEAKRFKTAIMAYREEIEYDPAGSSALAMKQIATNAEINSNEILSRLIANVYQDTRTAFKIQDKILKESQILAWVVLIVGIICSLSFIFLMSRALTRPIKSLLEGTKRIARGDLTSRVKVETKDEIGQFAASFNKMAEEINLYIQKEKELTTIAVVAAEAEKKKAEELEQAYQNLKEMKDMLIQAEKLNAVGQLASSIAHEVRNPLSIILQGVDYLEKTPALIKEKDVMDALGVLKYNVERANKIITALLDFSKSTELSLHPQSINSVIESSLLLVGHQVHLKNIKITRELQEGLPRVLVDITKIEQVFINLFLNAVQAMAAGGTLFIRSYPGQLKPAQNELDTKNKAAFASGNQAVIVEVEDTGSGIPEKYITKIFEPFFTTKGPRDGSGLGLAVSKNIIDMHQGFIAVESREGAGSKFIITLRLAE